jgi:hypothetical protein
MAIILKYYPITYANLSYNLDAYLNILEIAGNLS